MKHVYITSMLCALGLYAYGCGSGSGPSDPDTDDASSSSGESSSSSSGDVDPGSSSSSSGGVTTSSSSSSGQPSSSSSSSSSGSSGLPDAGDAGEPVQDCTVITTTGWVNSTFCGDGTELCTTVFESEFTPKFPNTFIDYVRFVFSPAFSTEDTPYSFSLDPAVWQHDLAGSVGNSVADMRSFKASSGTFVINSFDSSNGSVNVTLLNTKLVEVTYDANNVATPVEGGTCLLLTSTIDVQN